MAEERKTNDEPLNIQNKKIKMEKDESDNDDDNFNKFWKAMITIERNFNKLERVMKLIEEMKKRG